jgi:hypothetical protein
VSNHQKAIAIGEILDGRYEIESLIGRGGMGHVYLAKDLKLRTKRWAIKECLVSGSDAQQFIEEAEMLAKLNHPQLPHLFDYLSPNLMGYAYLIMDYIEGPTLQDRFNHHRNQLTAPTIARIAIQICDIFHYLHSFKPESIIYRDLKPSNVMIDEQLHVRLIDFGIARHHTLGQDADTVQLGTVGFAAPEQFSGKQTEPSSDLYALGAMMYYLLSGGEFAYRRRKQLSEIREDIEQAFSEMIERLLQENPRDRYASAQEVRQQLLKLFPEEHLPLHSTNREHSSQHIASVHVTPKLIVIGGLYAGVGTTFACISIARSLHALEVPHALIEHPANEPDLYMLLYGDRHAPASYRYIAEVIKREPGNIHLKHWESGYTTWVPISPEGYDQPWSNEDTFHMLYAIQKPITIWDISTNWQDPSVMKLCQSADEIIIVVDASPGKINRPSTQKHLQFIDKYRTEGKSIRFLANRESNSHRKQDWLSALPAAPVDTCPEVPYTDIKLATSKGECVQDQPLIQEQLFSAFFSLLQQIVPQKKIELKPFKQSSLLKKLIGMK